MSHCHCGRHGDPCGCHHHEERHGGGEHHEGWCGGHGHHDRCCCRGGHEGCHGERWGRCGCHERCCCRGRCGEGKHRRFERRFPSKTEEIAELEAYLAELKAEAQGVEERLGQLRR